MKLSIILLALAGAAPLITTAHADPCREVEPAVAERARAMLAGGPEVLRFCEPCGDPAPGVPAMAGSVAVAALRSDAHQLSIDDVVVDLASTFVQTSASRYQNLAMLAGCPTAGRSSSLAIVGETPTGVLILADPPHAPGAAGDAPAIASALPSEPSRSPHPMTWLAIAGAATGGFATAWFGLLGLMRLRRRRAFLPRAANLPLR